MNKQKLDLFADVINDRSEKMEEITESVVQKNGGDITAINESTGCPTTSKASAACFAAQEVSGVVENGKLHTKSSRN
ncbi:hypothetical protein [Burkholderia ambifaria]|uniref:hypothetical protein n=1 Tax=Burkholderia ambifaria TaxID=152480 RepID=UPI003C7C543C